ncbi:hypothetical protein OH77DRAFT_1417736 [Trametes cingulata]|nr:hypothetical protein OH77DRAFT_1417736 [Trametes cingulata]
MDIHASFWARAIHPLASLTTFRRRPYSCLHSSATSFPETALPADLHSGVSPHDRRARPLSTLHASSPANPRSPAVPVLHRARSERVPRRASSQLHSSLERLEPRSDHGAARVPMRSLLSMGAFIGPVPSGPARHSCTPACYPNQVSRLAPGPPPRVSLWCTGVRARTSNPVTRSRYSLRFRSLDGRRR